jgi:phosphate:Na+ symporter
VQALLNLLSAIALLVWGTHIVRTGLLRVWGANLRRVITRSVGNRVSGLLAGVGVTALLQSSTATALIVASFVGQRVLGTSIALAIMLGADIGTSLMTRLFSLDLSWLSPLLILVGVAVYLTHRTQPAGRIGRVVIGFGLILLALQLVVAATRPIAEAAALRTVLASLSVDPLLDALVGALLAMGLYSSLAVVLLTATLAGAGAIPTPMALCIVLGANVGSGVLAVLGTLGSGPEARRAPVGNLAFKLAGCVAGLGLLGALPGWLATLDAHPAAMVVNFHVGLNLAIAGVFLGAVGPAGRLVDRLLPARELPDDPSRPRHLDPVALQSPALAMSCATREAMRLADVVEAMLVGLLEALRARRRDLCEQLREMDDTVDDLYTAIKLYLTQVSREALEENEARRWADIMSFTINMEQVGDIVERVLMDVEDKLIARGTTLSEAGMAEILELHRRLLANLRLAMSVFLHGDLKSAQLLIAEKVQFRERERSFAATHLQRLAWNTPQSVETSSLHLDLIANLKRINSHLCSVAYPILEAAGALASSRLRELEPIAPQVSAQAEPSTRSSSASMPAS